MVIAKEPDASDKPFDPIRDINWTDAGDADPRADLRRRRSSRSSCRTSISTSMTASPNNAWSANPVAGIWKASREGVALNLDITLADAIRASPTASASRWRPTARSSAPLAASRSKASIRSRSPRCSATRATRSRRASPASAGLLGRGHRTFRACRAPASRSPASPAASSVGDQDVAVKDLAFDASYDPATKKIDAEIARRSTATGSRAAFTGELDADRHHEGR